MEMGWFPEKWEGQRHNPALNCLSLDFYMKGRKKPHKNKSDYICEAIVILKFLLWDELTNPNLYGLQCLSVVTSCFLPLSIVLDLHLDRCPFLKPWESGDGEGDTLSLGIEEAVESTVF